MTNREETSCPECGAPHSGDMTCWDLLGAILAWEWQDQDLAAEHFLTVATYNLQHPAQFTDAALAGLRDAFIDYLDRGITVDEIRRRVGRISEGSERVLKDDADQQKVRRPWPMTVADVYAADQPDGAAQRVRVWAASTRQELRLAGAAGKIAD